MLSRNVFKRSPLYFQNTTWKKWTESHWKSAFSQHSELAKVLSTHERVSQGFAVHQDGRESSRQEQDGIIHLCLWVRYWNVKKRVGRPLPTQEQNEHTINTH